MRAPARHHWVAQNADRPDGVTAAEARSKFGLNATAACSLMHQAEAKHQLVRVKRPGARNRWFKTHEQAQTWLAKQQQVMARLGKPMQAAGSSTRRSRQPQEAGSAAVATAATRKANRMTVSNKSQRQLGAALSAWADQPAVVTERTKVTVYVRTPSPNRVDLMADPLPGVPGWKSGPYIRPGSLAPRPQLHVEGGSK